MKWLFQNEQDVSATSYTERDGLCLPFYAVCITIIGSKEELDS
jgi:hypothetical protein